MRTKPGTFYGITTRGQMVELGDVDRAPDVVICRRIVDYAPFEFPPGARFTACTLCGARIAFNPADPFQHVPKICMQCAHTTPLPMDA